MIDNKNFCGCLLCFQSQPQLGLQCRQQARAGSAVSLNPKASLRAAMVTMTAEVGSARRVTGGVRSVIGPAQGNIVLAVQPGSWPDR